MSNTLNLKHSLPHALRHAPPLPEPTPDAKGQNRLRSSDDGQPVAVKPPTSSVEMNSLRSVQRYTLLTTLWLNLFVLPTDIKGVLHHNDLAGRDCPLEPQMPDADVRLRISNSPPGNPTLHGKGPG